MQIIDGFDKDHLKVTIILKRHEVDWDPGDEYANTFLSYVQNHLESLSSQEIVTVYDVYKELALKPKSMMAHLGWKPTDIFDMSYYVHENRIMISMSCHYL